MNEQKLPPIRLICNRGSSRERKSRRFFFGLTDRKRIIFVFPTAHSPTVGNNLRNRLPKFKIFEKRMKKIAIITGLLSGLLFGIAAPLSKILLLDYNSFQLAGLLYLGAGIAMIPFVIKDKGQIKLLFNTKHRLRTIGIVFFGGVLGPLLLLMGLKAANAASVSIWLNMELVATALLGILIFKDNLDKFTWIGVVLTFSAGISTSMGEGVSGLVPALIITAACVCWGIDNHLTAITDGVSPQIVTFVKGLMAGSVNLLIGISISEFSYLSEGIIYALIIGAFSYGLSIVLYVTSAQNIGATRSQILFSTAPIWGIILSYIIFKDSFHWTHIISIVLIALAIIAINMLSHKHSHIHIRTGHIHYHKHNDEHHNHLHNEEDWSKEKGHSHSHTHEPLEHDHSHYPDLHHRHNHE